MLQFAMLCNLYQPLLTVINIFDGLTLAKTLLLDLLMLLTTLGSDTVQLTIVLPPAIVIIHLRPVHFIWIITCWPYFLVELKVAETCLK